MRKILLIFVAMLALFTSCKSDSADEKTDTKAEKTTTAQINSTENVVLKDELPPMFCVNGICHFGSGVNVYDGGLRSFDYSLAEGYKLMGVISDTVERYPQYDFQSNYLLNGVPVLYNEEKNSYLLWTQEGRNWLTVKEHICTEKCEKIQNENTN